MSADAAGRAIFISYRRADAEGEAGRLYDDLVRAYGDDSVFLDVAGIQPGADFRKAIDTNIGGCGVLLAIIGPTWATLTDSSGARRLEHANDYVRLEIASALARNVAVIPVLVHDAHMPALELLPDDLKDLRYHNSVELTHARWNSDVALLITALKSYVTAADPQQDTKTVHATVPVQLPAPQPATPPPAKSRAALFAGIAVAVLILAGLGFYAYSRWRRAEWHDTKTANAVPVTPAAEAPFLGKWKNSETATIADELVRIEVVDFGGKLMVEAWGNCPQHACSWGSRNATLDGKDAVTAAWQPRNTPQENTLQRSSTLSLSPQATGMQITVKNRFHQANGTTTDNFKQWLFVKEK